MCKAYDELYTAQEWQQERFEALFSGRTGYPMVDACMRALAGSGWINFRMRAMVVSFACYHLWLDWRRLTASFARCMVHDTWCMIHDTWCMIHDAWYMATTHSELCQVRIPELYLPSSSYYELTVLCSSILSPCWKAIFRL